MNRPRGSRLRTPRVDYWPVYAVSAGVWASGACWLVFHYFFMRRTDFGPAPHPGEHGSILFHGAFAFASLWLLGFLWGTHVVKRWRLRRHRKTGGTLFAVMLLLVVSGYLLYYPASDEMRAAASLVHWIIGLAMPAALLGHWLVRAR